MLRVVQFGEGVFLRAFAEPLLQQVRNLLAIDLRVTLVQPRASDTVARLMAQSGRYTLLEQGLVDGVQRATSTEIDCIEAGINTHEDPGAFSALARDCAVRVILSNTTEAGIAWSDADAALDEWRLARSFPGKLTWLLAERHASGAGREPLFVIPCELIADNGQRLRELVTRMAGAWRLGDDFLAWLGSSVIFCDTLVDRIVPGRPAGQYRLLDGTIDNFPVQAEPFLSWYLSGAGDLFEVLPLDLVHPGVQLVDSLAPYRALKVRLLNGVHTALALLGPGLGVATVGQAIDHPELGPMIRRLVSDELAPSIDLPGGIVDSFADAMWGRFRNPFITHRLDSILLNSSAKIPARFGEVVQWRAGKGLPSPGIAGSVAAWLWLGRDGQLPDSAETNKRLRRLWRQRRSGALSVAELVAAASVDEALLGAVAWPTSFVTEVTLALEALETRRSDLGSITGC